MNGQAMQATHRQCGCQTCAHFEPLCAVCKAPWPCDAATARAALERIEALADGWREQARADGFGVAILTLRAIRDEARAALGEQA